MSYENECVICLSKLHGFGNWLILYTHKTSSGNHRHIYTENNYVIRWLHVIFQLVDLTVRETNIQSLYSNMQSDQG
jgi:hypothetical protein